MGEDGQVMGRGQGGGAEGVRDGCGGAGWEEEKGEGWEPVTVVGVMGEGEWGGGR